MSGMNDKIKRKIIEHLRSVPIIEVAVKRAGVARSTYYRWVAEDSLFAEQAEKALTYGKSIINDVAESQLITLIKEQNLGAIIYWLRHNHTNYSTKIMLSQHEIDQLTLQLQQGSTISLYEKFLLGILSNKLPLGITHFIRSFLHEKRVEQKVVLEDKKIELLRSVQGD